MTFLSRRWARPTVAARRVPKHSISALSPLLLTGLAGSFAAHAQIASTPRPVIEEQRQQERERALREQQERTVDARLPRQAATAIQRLPDREVPCFRIGLSVDNPFGLNDLFYINASHSIDGHGFTNPGKGTAGQIVHYSVPYGDWLFSATASRNDYHQNVAGYFQNYEYSGESSNAGVSVSRLLYRDQQRKTIASVRAFRRSSRNSIDDTEIEVQRRVIGGWELGLNHREFIGPATLDGNLVYRRGTGAFGAIPAPEEPFGEGTSRMRIITADLGVNLPFELSGQTLRYSALWRAQWNRTPLTPQDMFAIGGRFTVRGFDGELTLSGDRGWLVRNDIGLALGASGAELYAGIDHGEVGGLFVDQLIGRRLTGGVIGLRGAWQGLSTTSSSARPSRSPRASRPPASRPRSV